MSGIDLGALFAQAAGGSPGPLRKGAMPGGFGGLALLEPDVDELDLDELSELEKINPERVDGVSGPANGCPTLMLKALGSKRAAAPVRTRLVKTEGEKRVSIHLAYPSMRPDRARAVDGFRDFAGPDAVEDAAWSFMKAGAKIGLWHEQGTTGSGTCVESWVHRADPWIIKAVDGSTQTIMPGDWLIAVQWPEDVWALVKSGQINGVSMQGSASRRKPSAEALAGLRKANGGKKVKRRAARAQLMAKALADAQAARRAAIDDQVRKAARAVVADQVAEVYAQAAGIRERLEFLERQRAERARTGLAFRG